MSNSTFPPQTPINQFISQIYLTQIPYITLPNIPTSILLAEDPTHRFSFTYYGVSSVGNNPYRHFSLWDGWMEREYSVYVLLKRRKASIAGVGHTRRGSLDFGALDVSKNDEVRNAVTAALLQIHSKSMPSIDIVV